MLSAVICLTVMWILWYIVISLCKEKVMFKSEQEALEYLMQCRKIIVPSKFTYWCHSSQLQSNPNATQNPKLSKLWSELPTNGFTVRNEMSFLSRKDRLEYARRYQSLSSVPTSYTEVAGQEGFQIKVMMPRMNLTKEDFQSLGKDNEYQKNLSYQYRGLGDGRHPKLPNKSEVHMFGFMDHDEMSGKPIKTMIGVRGEDLIAYATEVKKELREKSKTGILQNSELSVPDFNGVLVDEKETNILGDNLYGSEIIRQPKPQKAIHEEEVQPKSYDLSRLEGAIEHEFEEWIKSEDALENRYKTIVEARDSRFGQRPTIGGLSFVHAQNGNVDIDMCNRASAQRSMLQSLKLKCDELAKGIEGHLSSHYGNYIHYATNDYCDLEALDALVPKVQQRLADLEVYEENVGNFETTVSEEKTTKKPGIRGFLGAKQKEVVRRKLTHQEMCARMDADIVKLNTAFNEGRVSEDDYERCMDAINRLYGAENVSRTKVGKVAKGELDLLKEAEGSTQSAKESNKDALTLQSNAIKKLQTIKDDDSLQLT